MRYPREVKTAMFTLGSFMPNGDRAPCDVIQESDQERCLRCRAVWDAGDGLYCAKFYKPVLSIRSLYSLRPSGKHRNRFRYLIRWRKESGEEKVWRSPVVYSSRDRAYADGMRRIELLINVGVIRR